MDTAELGHRIKEARIAKKMTQSQVVGNFITRNMLSQIENGAALPSVRTLQYLADVLDAPDILDFSSGGSEKGESSAQCLQDNSAFSALAAARSAVQSKDWYSVIAMEPHYPAAFADEFAALFAMSFLALGRDAMDKPDQAAAFLKKALIYADTGIYASASRKADAVILLQQLAASLSSASD